MLQSRSLAITLLGSLSFSVPAFAQTVTKPINDLPNPYQTIEGWARMPEGRSWGSTSAVAIAATAVWGLACAGSSLRAVPEFAFLWVAIGMMYGQLSRKPSADQ